MMGGGAAIACAPVEMLCRRKNGAGGASPDEFWTSPGESMAANMRSRGRPVSPGENTMTASSEEVCQSTPIGVDGMVEGGGTGMVYEDKCINGAWWMGSFGPLGPRRSMSSGGRGSGSVVRVAPWVAASSP